VFSLIQGTILPEAVTPPGDLRTAFEEAVEAVCDWNEGDPEPTVEVGGREILVSAVCGLLWNCGDIVPLGTMECVDPDFGCGSYAAAARVLKSVTPRRRAGR
jgi:hypothetical protein